MGIKTKTTITARRERKDQSSLGFHHFGSPLVFMHFLMVIAIAVAEWEIGVVQIAEFMFYLSDA